MLNSFSSILNFFFPPLCPLCKKRISFHHSLCQDCFSKITFISSPLCEICGLPLPYETPWENICGECSKRKPLYVKQRSAFIYNDFSKPLLLSFKHGDRLDLSPLLVKILSTCGKDLLKNTDLIIPVPLHRYRLFKRKYNQAAILALLLAKRYHKPYDPLSLKRIRATKSQGHLSYEQRKRNISNAFKVFSNKKIYGKKILLIDDVITSGSTIHACTQELLRAGADSVCVLSLARVVKA